VNDKWSLDVSAHLLKPHASNIVQNTTLFIGQFTVLIGAFVQMILLQQLLLELFPHVDLVLVGLIGYINFQTAKPSFILLQLLI